MYTSLMLQFYFQLKICILQGTVHNRCGATILYEYQVTLQVILVNIFVISYVSKNELSAHGISIFHFCMLNLKVSHKFTALVFGSVNCGLQLQSFWRDIHSEAVKLNV